MGTRKPTIFKLGDDGELPLEQDNREKVKLTVALLMAIITLGALMAIVGTAVMAGRSTSSVSTVSAAGTDSAVLPAALEETPVNFWVGNIKDGQDGWTSPDFLFVDSTGHVWLPPDVVAQNYNDDCYMPPQGWPGCTHTYTMHIKREGDHFIVFLGSLKGRTYTPGKSTGYREDNTLPVLLRGGD